MWRQIKAEQNNLFVKISILSIVAISLAQNLYVSFSSFTKRIVPTNNTYIDSSHSLVNGFWPFSIWILVNAIFLLFNSRKSQLWHKVNEKKKKRKQFAKCPNGNSSEIAFQGWKHIILCIVRKKEKSGKPNGSVYCNQSFGFSSFVCIINGIGERLHSNQNGRIYYKYMPRMAYHLPSTKLLF